MTACSIDEYAEDKRTEKNLIVRSGISEAESEVETTVLIIQEAQLSQRGRACFVFVCSQLQHTAQFFTAASDLLLHKILLNSVLLSLIVSGGVRPKLSKQVLNAPYLPNGKAPLFSAVRGSVGVRTPPRGSDRVRSTG